MMGVNLKQEGFLQNHEIKDEIFYSKRNLVGFEDVVIWVSPNSLAEALDQFQNSSKPLTMTEV